MGLSSEFNLNTTALSDSAIRTIGLFMNSNELCLNVGTQAIWELGYCIVRHETYA